MIITICGQSLILPFRGHSSSIHRVNCCAGPELLSALQEIDQELKSQGVTVYALAADSKQLQNGFQSFDELMAASSEETIPRSVRDGITLADAACFIYTSGTTGLPKAAVVSHAKLLKATSFMQTANANSDDIIYTSLPLYHSAALAVGVSAAIQTGKEHSHMKMCYEKRKENIL